MLCCIWLIDEKPSIKDHEHQRPSRNASSYIKVDLHNQSSCSQKAFLKNSKNKAKFSELLSKHLPNDGHGIWNSKSDADTLIVSTAIQYTKKQDNEVVVVANDTDILVLLIYHLQKSMKLFMYSSYKKVWLWETDLENWRCCPGIRQWDSKTDFIYPWWTGCDTTSAIYQQGTLYFSLVQFSLFIMITYKSLFIIE